MEVRLDSTPVRPPPNNRTITNSTEIERYSNIEVILEQRQQHRWRIPPSAAEGQAGVPPDPHGHGIPRSSLGIPRFCR